MLADDVDVGTAELEPPLSRVRVSVVVDRERGEEALACLRAAFNVPS